MKKNILTWLLIIIISMTGFSGCTATKSNKPDESAKQTEKSQPDNKSKKQEETDKEAQEEEEQVEEKESSGKAKMDKKKSNQSKKEKEERDSEEDSNQKGKADKKNKATQKDEENKPEKKDTAPKDKSEKKAQPEKDKTEKQDKSPKKESLEKDPKKQSEEANNPNKLPPETLAVIKKELEATEAYSEVLSTIYDIIETGSIDFEKYMGETQILETINAYGQTRLFELFGYCVMDISGDGIPELIIGNRQGNPNLPLTYVYSIHTLDQGKPYLVLESGTNYSLYAAPDGKIFTSDVEDNIHDFGLFQLTKNGQDIKCLDFYFSVENPHVSETYYYQNKIGVIDVDQSTALSVSAENFSALENELIRKMSVLPLLPFAAYERRKGQTYGVTAEKTVFESGALFNTTVIEIDKNPQTDVLLHPERPIKNLKILSLSQYFDDKGRTRYNTKVIREIGDVDFRTSYILRMNFAGESATVGFSYEEDGRTRSYSLNMDDIGDFIYLEFF
ncbi:hypothetical protein EII17_14265 [Clostridiales bacterium COT073_COT-073]|nr:hypothetical protein EII17_14265 [Clostridiales bacterium COT073_COT-073]